MEKKNLKNKNVWYVIIWDFEIICLYKKRFIILNYNNYFFGIKKNI